ncbi:MAG: lipase/acyltransferase domain-containing protein [Pikeienuella sp.]
MRILGFAFILLALVGCESGPKLPNLSQIYDNAAMTESQDRRPVITIPGLLGSRLVDRGSGTVVWGDETRLSLDPSDPVATRLIALPIGDGLTPLKQQMDDIRPRGVLRTAKTSVLGVPVSLDIYGGIVRTLIAGGFDFRLTRKEEIEERNVNLDSFEFPYDWRRGVVEAAQDLDYFIKRKKKQVAAARRDTFGDATKPVKFDIIAHSMGGLVARYYLMYGAAELPEDGSLPPLTWAGAKNVDRVIYVAPPNAGSARTAMSLVNGRSLGFLQPNYRPGLIATHISTYQLLPRNRHHRVTIVDEAKPVDLYDIETWDRLGWGLLDPREDELLEILLPEATDRATRRTIARAHVAQMLERADHLHRAMDRKVEQPPGLEAFLVVGGGEPTLSNVSFDKDRHEMIETAWGEGDGVVLRASSLLDERQGGVYTLNLRTPLSFQSILLLPEEHLAITQSPVFGDNVLFWLLEAPRNEDL